MFWRDLLAQNTPLKGSHGPKKFIMSLVKCDTLGTIQYLGSHFFVTHRREIMHKDRSCGFCYSLHQSRGDTEWPEMLAPIGIGFRTARCLPARCVNNISRSW